MKFKDKAQLLFRKQIWIHDESDKNSGIYPEPYYHQNKDVKGIFQRPHSVGGGKRMEFIMKVESDIAIITL